MEVKDGDVEEMVSRESLPMHFGHKEASKRDNPNLVPPGVKKKKKHVSRRNRVRSEAWARLRWPESFS